MAGHPQSEATREKIRKYRLGKKNSEETRKKISEKALGHKPYNTISPMQGKKHKKSTLEKMSASHIKNPSKYWKGKIPTVETRKKISEALKGENHIYGKEG